MLFPDYDDQTSHTSVIREHYVFLLETLDVKFSGLVGHLYSKDVLSAVERDDIMAEMTSFRANEKLLSALSRKSPQQFQLFLDALDNCAQRHVCNAIAGRPPGLSLLLLSSNLGQVDENKQHKHTDVKILTFHEKSESNVKQARHS